MLQLLQHAFITPLRHAAKKPGIYMGRPFSEKDVAAVFGMVEKPLPVHEALLKDLEQRYLSTRSTRRLSLILLFNSARETTASPTPSMMPLPPSPNMF